LIPVRVKIAGLNPQIIQIIIYLPATSHSLVLHTVNVGTDGRIALRESALNPITDA
jgi:hypothetical protein